jgi:hypothetical protein
MTEVVSGKTVFTQVEEQTVTTNYEQPAARAFGEDPRINYHGDGWKPKRLPCVICTRN